MKTKTTFYSWLSENTRKQPSSKTDDKILSYAREVFKPEENPARLLNWKISGVAVFASIALVIILMNRTPVMQSGDMMLAESPEMILNYNEIELMADASQLSESDWAKINGH